MAISGLGRRAAITFVRVSVAFRDIVQGTVLYLLLVGARDFFDADHYAGQRPGGRRPRFPRLHYAFVGARRMADPSARFSQAGWLRDHPRIAGRGYLPVLFYLLFDPAARGLTAAETPPVTSDASSPAAQPHDRFRVLWPAIQRDMAAIRDHERFLSAAPVLGEALSSGRDYPGPAIIGRPLRLAFDVLPQRIDHMLVVPWIGIAGGSERITQRLLRVLREHYGDEGVAIVGPDSTFDLAHEQSAGHGTPMLSFDALAAEAGTVMSVDQRIELLDRIISHWRPRTLHCINSWVGWRALQERACYYKTDSRIFGNVYSDVRLAGGLPVGAFWDFMPDCFDHLEGVFSDNETVVRKAKAFFGYTAQETKKFHVIYTPVLGADPAAPDLRVYNRCEEQHSLWMSRIAVEKRVELVGEIARAMPSRQFSIYGAVLKGAVPVDLRELAMQPNVRLAGEYGRLPDLPFDRFDSYVFTTTAEGLPIALLEAAQFGLPSVAPDIGGIGEFIDDSTGWLVPAESRVEDYVAALDYIHRDPAEAARRVAAAQRRLVERHSFDAFRAGLRAVPQYLQRG